MKKSWLVKIILLIVYCIPYVFLAINGDAKHGTMLFYIIMLIGFTLLHLGAIKTKSIAIIYIGQILSFISSYIIAKVTKLDPMGWYFKPFTSYSMIIAITIGIVIIETIIIVIYKNISKKEI